MLLIGKVFRKPTHAYAKFRSSVAIFACNSYYDAKNGGYQYVYSMLICKLRKLCDTAISTTLPCTIAVSTQELLQESGPLAWPRSSSEDHCKNLFSENLKALGHFVFDRGARVDQCPGYAIRAQSTLANFKSLKCHHCLAKYSTADEQSLLLALQRIAYPTYAIA